MKHMPKRITMLLMAAMLILSNLGAAAQAPDALGVQPPSGRVRMESTAEFDVDQLMGLIVDSTQGIDESGAEALILRTVLNAIEKLTISEISDGDADYVSIGSPIGELFDFYMTFDEQYTLVVTSLLPGIELAGAQGMSDAQSQMILDVIQQDFSMLEGSLPHYGKAVMDYVAAEILPQGQEEKGSFEFNGDATYDTRLSLEAKSHMVAGLFEKLMDTFKNDQPMQDVFDQMVEQLIAQEVASGQMPATVLDENISGSQVLIEAVEGLIDGIRNDENISFARLQVLSSTKTQAVSVEAELIDSNRPMALLSFSYLPNDLGELVSLSLLTLEQTRDEMIDWKALRERIEKGREWPALLVEAVYDRKSDEDANLSTINGSLNVNEKGFHFGIDIETAASMTGTAKSESAIAISVMNSSPLLTIRRKGHETEEELPLLDRTSLKRVVLDDDLSEKETEAFGEALMIGLPQLMERLKVVLPVEGPLLESLIKNVLFPGLVYEN